MSWSSGDKITAAKLNTMETATTLAPMCSYTFYKSGALFYGVCNVPGGTDATPDADADTVINAAISAGDCESVFFKEASFTCNAAVAVKNNLKMILENRNTEIKATANMTRLIDAVDHSGVQIYGGKIDGGGYATNVVDFTQSSGTCTYNVLADCLVMSARDIANSCLVNMYYNSETVLRGNILDGNDTAHYGVYLNKSDGQNTIWNAGIYRCVDAYVYQGGGKLKIFGGAMADPKAGSDGGIVIKPNGQIIRTLLNGVWIETSGECPVALIEEGSAIPHSLVFYDCYLLSCDPPTHSIGIESTTTSNHLQCLDVFGGTICSGTANAIDCTCTTAKIMPHWIDGAIDKTKITRMFNFEPSGDFETITIDTKGMTLHLSNNEVIRWRNAADAANLTILKMNASDNVELQMRDGIIYDPKNHVHSALSGTKKLVEIDIAGTPYYFEVHPTKA